jgi:hypothetical protein
MVPTGEPEVARSIQLRSPFAGAHWLIARLGLFIGDHLDEVEHARRLGPCVRA